MSYRLLSAAIVEAVHDAALNPGELAGRARDKSLEVALARVETRLSYGMIEDAFDLAAAYALAIATGHCFNDGKKRTAFDTMTFCLHLHGIRIAHNTQDVGDLIIALAQGKLGEDQLAAWLRQRAV